MNDETVECSWENCRWNLQLLDPARKPSLCLYLNPEDIEEDTVPDFLEPCYWWERMYGDMQPSQAPTFSRKYPSWRLYD